MIQRSLPLLVFLFALLSCSAGTKTAGGNTAETGNSFALQVKSADSKPMQGARVVLRERRYLDSLTDTTALQHADLVLQTLTDSLGQVSLPMGDSARVVEVASPDGALLSAMVVPAKPVPVQGRNEVRILGGLLSLRNPVVASGRVVGPAGARLFVRIPGLGRVQACDSLGRFRIDSLPSANLSVEAIAVQGPMAQTIRAPLALQNETVLDVGILPVSAIDTAAWLGATEVFVATQGFATSLSVPLLVRLDSTAVDFSVATPKSLRVIRDGNLLPFQVAAWDSAHGQGTLWVRVNGIPGGTDSLRLLVLWGNPVATELSSASDAFPAEQGWLLNDALEDSAVGVVAGAASFDGLASGPGAARTLPDSFAMAPVGWTVTGWLRVDGTLDNTMVPLAAGSGTAFWSLLGNDSQGLSLRIENDAGAVEASSPVQLDSGRWVRVAVQIDPQNRDASLLLDTGALVTVHPSGTFPSRTGLLLGYGLVGRLDEVQVRRGNVDPPQLRFEARTQSPTQNSIHTRRLR